MLRISHSLSNRLPYFVKDMEATGVSILFRGTLKECVEYCKSTGRPWRQYD